MNKQEAIEKIEASKRPFVSGKTFDHALDIALNIVKQLDEPQKPVVPQCVADWYEDNEDGFEFNLYILCLDYNNCEVDKKLSDWFCDKHNKPLETLVNMHQFGYKVEKEKLYTVEIPNPHGLGHTVLVKDMYGNTFITYTTDSNWRECKVNHLTESEIKKDFPWAWQFEEEVEE